MSRCAYALALFLEHCKCTPPRSQLPTSGFGGPLAVRLNNGARVSWWSAAAGGLRK